eukprot:48555-Eustigmatos_ZCMA.PRE.1
MPLRFYLSIHCTPQHDPSHRLAHTPRHYMPTTRMSFLLRHATAAERAWEVMLHSDRQPLSPYMSGRDIYALSICAKRFVTAHTQLRHIS